MAHILIIEDEKDLQRVLAYNISREGHSVSQALEGHDGLHQARHHKPDLILLDLMLPDISGLEVCKALKASEETQHIPILILTAKGEEADRVLGFELGAEDYVVKPFSVRELLLRVQAILRRASRNNDSPTENSSSFGCLRIDCDAHKVWVEEEEITLTAIEFKLLLTLFERRNRVQPRSRLLQDVWGHQIGVETRTVDTHVKRLREKLKQAQDYIETVRGVGYRFADKPETRPL